MVREKFQKTWYSFCGKCSWLSPRIVRKRFFTLDKYRSKIWVENSVSAIQRIRNRKKFFGGTKLIFVHAFVVLF